MRGQTAVVMLRRGLVLGLAAGLALSQNATLPAPGVKKSPPNLLMILVDDLGYGDLSVSPFVGQGIKTPELEKMALSSVIMTNFHVTAPICTPSRASILTGLFPWRLGIYSIYGSGPQSEEHLAVVPNAPMAFLQAGYHTAHVGKWHLGGLRPQDVATRREQMQVQGSCAKADPGPTQHGFSEYVAMEEGLGSQRLITLLPSSTLYHRGAQHLIRNDRPHNKSSNTLTDRQTDEAIRIMRETSARGQPFYMHLWYDAPHGPWETIAPFNKLYTPSQFDGKASRNDRNYKYATMVSSVDANIGRLRRALDEMKISQDTVIVFLSDNGPEEGAGSAGPYRGRKRDLHEGGIRVPCMWEWKGHFAENKRINMFALSTDIFPTFLAAAGLTKPPGYHLDGTSILDLLLLPAAGAGAGKEPEANPLAVARATRTALWHKDITGKASAAWAHGFKVIVNGGPSVNIGAGDRLEAIGGGPVEMYDMAADEREARPLAQTAGVTPASTLGRRDDPRHVGKIRMHLHERLKQFVEQGNALYSKHKAKETRACAAPRPGDVAPFDWSLLLTSVPEF